jgi:cob(I)alamin adenosyltransferase
MKIYTKTGDDGRTGLFGGDRVEKHDMRVEAYGAIDELNSALGAVRATPVDDSINGILADVQRELFDLGAELATAPQKTSPGPPIGAAEVAQLERIIDDSERELRPLKSFVLPGGSPAGALLHVARTGCRRAERRVVELHAAEPVRSEILHYLNRLSDLLFVLARLANKRAGVDDVPWVGRDRTP